MFLPVTIPALNPLRSLNENQDRVSTQNTRNYTHVLHHSPPCAWEHAPPPRAGGEREDCADEFCNTLPDRLNTQTLPCLLFTSLTCRSPEKKKNLKRKRRNMIKNKLKTPTCNKAGTGPRLQKCLTHDTDFTDTLQIQYMAFIGEKRGYLHYLKQVANTFCFENAVSLANKCRTKQQNKQHSSCKTVIRECRCLHSASKNYLLLIFFN